MTRNPAIVFILAVLAAGFSLPAASQTSAELQNYFRDSIGLSQEQIADIRNGKAVAKVLKSRTPAEIFVFGAVYIKATPDNYVKLAGDFDRLRKLPEFLAIGKFSDPPRAADLEGFKFDSDDIKSLKECKPGDCDVQMPAEAIENIHKSINWSAPPAELDRQVSQHLHERVIEGLRAYQRDGNQALGVYVDKENPTNVPKQFEYMLSYAKALPKYLPDFHPANPFGGEVTLREGRAELPGIERRDEVREPRLDERAELGILHRRAPDA